MIEEGHRESFLTPFLQVTLKKEEDIDLLTSCAEKYKLKILGANPYYPLVYNLHVTLESKKTHWNVQMKCMKVGISHHRNQTLLYLLAGLLNRIQSEALPLP